MKKAFLSFGFITLFAFYATLSRGGAFAQAPDEIVSTSTNFSPIPETTDAQTVPITPVATPTPTPAPATKPKGQYTDGNYTGSAANAFYGIVQVQAVISGGKLSDVKFLQYPSDRDHSAELSQYSLPILKQEAIAAQSAKVNIVSGATQTSEGFRASLGVALKAALNS